MTYFYELYIYTNIALCKLNLCIVLFPTMKKFCIKKYFCNNIYKAKSCGGNKSQF